MTTRNGCFPCNVQRQSTLFSCNLEHNRTTNCSIIKMFDILDDGAHTGECRLDSATGLPERTLKFLRENLLEAFSYLPSSYLKSLILNSDFYLRDCYSTPDDSNLEASLRLFGFVDIPVVRNAVIPMHTFSLLFKFTKKNLNQLRSYLGESGLCTDRNFSDVDASFYELRQSISDFFAFLKRFLFFACSQMTETSHQSFSLFQLCASILKELKCLLIFTGRLSQFQQFFWSKRRNFSTATEVPFQHLSDQKTILYNYYHTVLEIWWSTVEIAYLMQTSAANRFSFNDITLVQEEPASVAACKINGHPMFTQSIRILLYDLLLLGSRSQFTHFDGNFSPGNDYHYQTPFICTCSWEVVVALRMMITQGINSAADSTLDSQEQMPQVKLESFYDFLFAVLSLFGSSKEHSQSKRKFTEDDIFQDSQMYIEHFFSIANPKIAISNAVHFRIFQLWIFSNIAPLLSLDLNLSNRLQISCHSVTQPAILTRLLRMTLKEFESSNDSTQEMIVYNLLILTLKSSQFLSTPNFDVLILFVEHFLKKLNVNYSVYQSKSAATIQEYSWMPRNSAHWLKAIDNSSASAGVGANNFKLFLILLASQLTRLFSNDDMKTQNANFQKLTSKIVVTLQPRTLKQLDPMGVFNLGTFYLTMIAFIPAVRWTDIADKALGIFQEIARNVAAERKPNGSTVELVMQFHFALLQEKFSDTVNGKVAAQLVKLFEKFQSTDMFNNSLKHYHSLVRLYFDELELLLGKLKKTKCGDELLEHSVELLLGLDLIQLCRNVRSSRKSPEARPPKIVEFLNEVLQYTIRTVTVAGESAAGVLNSDQLAIPLMDSSDLAPVKRSHSLDVIEEFAKKLIEKLKELVKIELVPFAEETDVEAVSTIVFNMTLLSLLIENRSISSTQPLLVTIKFFLNITEKPLSSYQINYLYLLFEDYQVISRLKEEEHTNELPTSETVVVLISTWCRLLPIGITATPEKMCSISRNLFCNLLALRDTSFSAAQNYTTEDTLSYYCLLLRQLHAQHSRLVHYQEKANHYSLVSRIFGPLVTECRALFASITNKSNSVTSNVRQLKTAYWLVAYLVKFVANQMYTAGKADCLLAVICEHLLVGPNAALVDGSDSTLAKTFPLIFEGLCQLNLDPYLERKTRLLVVFNLPYFLKKNNFDQIKNLFTEKKLYDRWKTLLCSALEKIYLIQRDQMMSKPVYEYLLQFCTTEVMPNDGQLMQLLRHLVTALSLTDFNKNDNRVLLWQQVVCMSVKQTNSKSDLIKQCLGVIIAFVSANLQNRPVKCFEVLRSLLPRDVQHTSTLFFHELCGELHRLLDEVERQTVSGTNSVLRKLLKDFITSYVQSTTA